MVRRHLPGRKALLFGGLVVVLGGLLLGGGFVLSGFYDVAASRPHFDITNALIRLTLRRSVETRSMGVDPPEDVGDAALARLGARHFEVGCAPCHGSPAARQSPVVAEMYPAPPPLSEAVGHWETEELFWIVKHGLKFTGMPAWPALERDEEIWALVAFLERLPGLDAESYAGMAGLPAPPGEAGLDFSARTDVGDLAEACANCHGDAGGGPVHPLAPPLAGQKQPYLQRALAEYARNRRQSGIMEAAVAEVDKAAIEELARLFSEAEVAPPPLPGATDTVSVGRGAELAARGVPGDDIPACLSCHAAGTSGHFPRLDGLPARYIAAQLRLFREGVRNGSTYAAVMAPVARRLSEEQIEDVAAYFSSLRPDAEETARR